MAVWRRLPEAEESSTFSGMKAILVESQDPERSLTWRDVPDPEPGPGQVVVDIHATAVNRADLLQRAGHYPPPPGEPDYLGLEMAGIVVESVGGSQWQPGDRVCALLGGGGYAERVAVDGRLLMPVPGGWPLTRAAAVPEVFVTAWVNLFREAGLQRGETVLIHGGASGVGTAAIQMAREAGCRVLATAGTEEKRQRCRDLGAELAVDYRDTDFGAEILRHLQRPGDAIHGVDVVLDIAGASHLARNLEALAPLGRLVLLAVLGGTHTAIDLGTVLRKRLRIIGSTLRSRPVAEKGDIIAGFRAQFWQALVDGRLEPIVDRVLPITAAGEAHAVLERNENIGKVVLQVRP